MSELNANSIKAEVLSACLQNFPEAEAIVFWGGLLDKDFHPASSDVDVIIEIDQASGKESDLSERLKTLVQVVKSIRLDPFLFLTSSKDNEALEFIAPFGFYKANPFIPHYLSSRNEVALGESLLLGKLKETSLRDALNAYFPQVMASLRRLRMDAEIETSVDPIIGKHQAALFVILRTLHAYEVAEIASKRKSLDYLLRRFPRYESLVNALGLRLKGIALEESGALTPELLLSFSHDMAEALQGAHKAEPMGLH